MKLTALFVMLMAVLALFAGAGDAAPRPDPKVSWGALVKTGETIKNIVTAVSAAATAHDLYQSARNKIQG
ncbi:hypothetical protein PYW07_003290 [Mythimna separata]|uniref:Uncharacterized protein n=1 Tax=Mythimna separata TaxID=271217 RepID=A0AAD8DQG9_MYTSE|nr:hypothetical protein PYW07_003290 [Mythimna separata]